MTRSIDADMCIAKIKEFDAETVQRCIEIVSNAPTIDAVPVRHGKWIKTGRWGRDYQCDQCRNYLDFDGVNAGRGSANFCPNCGAYMRGEK